jgi:peptidoglycan/xylan/chitin deacetylase (PgdA/CDA1 family)
MPFIPARPQRPGAAAGTPAISRRRLIVTAALVAGAGVTDAACGASRKGRTALRATQPTGRIQAAGKPTSTIRRTPSALADKSTTPRPAGHAAHHDNGGHHPAHHGHRDNHHHHAGKHVQLPPAQIPVRTHPAYYVDQIVKDPPKHAIGLTIDDGPDPDWTPKVLRLLDKYRVKATFCVVGVHADAYPRLVRDIDRAGHALVNHTYTHVQPFNAQNETRIVAEITRTQRAIERAAKVTPQLFRSPGGDWSPFIYQACAAYDLVPLDWDIDPDDWARPGTTKIRKRMMHARPNDIVLCHDGGGNRSETVRALRKVLPGWRHRGYTVIPLVLPPPAAKTVKSSPTPPAKTATTPPGTPTP